MPATLYLRPSPRAFLLVTDTHALIFRQPDASQSKATRSVVVAEFLPIEEVDIRGLVKASKGQSVDGVLGVTSVPSERSPIPEIFLILVSHSTPLSPFLPSSTLRPSRVVSVEFHSLSSSFWDPPDLAIAAHSAHEGYDIDDDDRSGLYGPSSSSGPSTIQSEAQKQGLENPCDGMRKYLESGGFFYAEGCKWDISTRMGETNWVQAERNGPGLHPLETFDERFIWNKSLLAPFLAFRSGLPNEIRDELDAQSLLIPVVQGFVGSSPVSTGNWTKDGQPEIASLGMISRQSWKRAGARFRTRGIDDDGQVANFVETELILATENVCMSYVQVRGSVPLFWQQPSAGIQTLQQKVEITRPPQATQPAFDKHFLELLEHYHSVHAVNLLGQKDAESMLTAAYSDHLEALKTTLDSTPSLEKEKLGVTTHGTLDLTPYDFHSAVRLNGHDSIKYDLSSRLREITRSMNSFGWTVIDAGTGQIVEQQQGVFRVNCLDCLDRTNYVQDVISSITLSRFLSSINSDLRSNPTLWTAHRILWADNGDRLSKIYAGTGAINTSATRSGKKTFAGLLSDATKSVGRAYINNFQDKGKQTSIDMLLGMMAGQRPVILFDPISDSVQSALRARTNEYSSTRNVTIFSGTWNLNGTAPDEALDAWLFPANAPEPDIYIIAFQEIVQLTAGQILQTDPAKKRMWEKFIMDTFAMRKDGSDYILLRSDQLVGTALIVIVKSSLTKAIRNVESTTKKTGLSGLSGNKGGVGIRFDLFDSTVCFVTAHFAAGQSSVTERNADYKVITSSMRFLRGKMIEDHDIVVWAGDFNYRVALPNQDVREALENDDIDSLLSTDQLLSAMDAGEAFIKYDEGPIRFRPTYKFDNGTNVYDSSEKQRVPSWTDRVLFRGDALRLKEYNRAELSTSDHRPVYAVFDATIRQIDHARKDAIAKDILHSIIQTGGGRTVDDKVERALYRDNGLSGLVRGMTDLSASPALRSSSPRLPPRPPSAASMQERPHPLMVAEAGRHRSISNLSPATTSASISRITHSASSSSLNASPFAPTAGAGAGLRRAAPPIPARPHLVPIVPDKRVTSIQPPRPDSSLSTHASGLTTTASSISSLPPLNTSSTPPPISPSSTGDYVVVPRSIVPSPAITNRTVPPLPPRVSASTPIMSATLSSSPKSTVATSATKSDDINGSRPTPPGPYGLRKSMDLNAPPPSGLMSPVSPDVVMPRISSPSLASRTRTFSSSSTCPSIPINTNAAASSPPVTTPISTTSPPKGRSVSEISKMFEGGVANISASKKGPPIIPKKPVALRSASNASNSGDR